MGLTTEARVPCRKLFYKTGRLRSRSSSSLPGLAESILAPPTIGAIFVVTEFGKRFSVRVFGNKFRQWCDEAGLPNCSAHGLLQSRDQGVDRTHDRQRGRPYTAAADQRTLSDTAADELLANLAERLAKDAPKALTVQGNK